MPKNETNQQSIKDNLEHAFLKIAQHPVDKILENKHPKLQLELLASGLVQNTFTTTELKRVREYNQILIVDDLENNLALPSETHPEKVSNIIRKEELKELKGTISNDQYNSSVLLKELPISNSRRNLLKGLAGIGGLAVTGKSTEIVTNQLQKRTSKVGYKVPEILPDIAENLGEGLIQNAKDFEARTKQISNSISNPVSKFFDRKNEQLKLEEAERLAQGIKRMNP